MGHEHKVAKASSERSSHGTDTSSNELLGHAIYELDPLMNAIVKHGKGKHDRYRVREIANHDPCLLSFRCDASEIEEIDDRALRKKGFLSFLDSFIDPLAGTHYVICALPPMPKSTGSYFEKAGKHIAWVMHSAKGGGIVGSGRRANRR